MANARGIPAQSVVENDYWRMAVVPDWGGQMTSLVYRPANEELLRVPPSHEAWLAQPYLYGIPILFPPGRIRGGEFRWRNETYHWPKTDTAGPNHLHGFVANQPWDVVDWTPHSMALETDAAADETMARYFGARVHLTVRYVLEGPWAGIRVAVRNDGQKAIPFGVGFHTTWTMTEHDWTLILPSGDEWEMGEDLMPTGRFLAEPLVLKGLGQGRSARDVVADTCYRVRDGVSPEVIMRHPVLPLQFRWRADEPFRHLVVYRPAESPFICVEPYTWTHNAVNLGLPDAVTGVAGLNPGETRVYAYGVSPEGG